MCRKKPILVATGRPTPTALPCDVKVDVTTMAYLNQTSGGFDLRSLIAGLATKAGALLRGIAEDWRRARAFQETYARLDSLSTRQLDDMGLSRSMITRVAYEAAYGPKA